MAAPIFNQLANSEKFVYVALLYILPLTVFAAMGKITIQFWSDQALYAVGILVLGKTVQGSTQAISDAMVAKAEVAAAGKSEKKHSAKRETRKDD